MMQLSRAFVRYQSTLRVPNTHGCAVLERTEDALDDVPAWLHRLGADLMARQLTKACFRLEVMRALLDRLGAHRVRLWRVRHPGNTRHLQKVGGLDASNGEEPIGDMLDERQDPDFFAVMDKAPFQLSCLAEKGKLRLPRKTVDVGRAGEDSQDPDLLQVRVVINGRIAGLVQCWRNRSGPPWSLDDVCLVQRSMAAVVMIVTRHEQDAARRRLW
ncbi:hypothetical protein [Roseateles sp. P5_E11]